MHKSRKLCIARSFISSISGNRITSSMNFNFLSITVYDQQPGQRRTDRFSNLGTDYYNIDKPLVGSHSKLYCDYTVHYVIIIYYIYNIASLLLLSNYSLTS